MASLRIYLRHRSEIDEYVLKRENGALESMRRIENSRTPQQLELIERIRKAMMERQVSATLQFDASTLEAERPPIRIDESGALRVGDSRVLVVLVISEHKQGMSPEQIHAAYDTATLADIYGVIAYYHRHTEELDNYIAEYEREGARLRRRMEAEHGPFMEEIRLRIAERNAAKNKG